MPNVHELIRDHVTLSIRCLDRLYLHAYMPKLQTSGGLCYFLRDHLGHPIPSPALFAPMLDRFVWAIKTYATRQDIPLITFERTQRKDDVVAEYRRRRPMDDGVVVVGVAQEKMRAFKAHKRSGPQGGVTFDFSRQSVAVNHYYFYVQDPDWGPAFLKFGTYEAVIRENLDLGRPDRVGLLFPHRITRKTRPPAWGYRTRVITDGVEPSLHIEYKSSHVKQYFKEQRALRTETTINNPTDFDVAKAVPNLTHLRDLGDQVNRKLLEVERVSHQCVLSQDALDRLQRPTLEAGQRTSALRFGDPRVMALFQAITGFAHLPRGFRNRDLRPRVEALLGRPYSTSQMTYDLRRLRLKGVIYRIPQTHRYIATSYGLKVAFFSAKLYLRILRPEWPALLPAGDHLPRPLRAALDTLDAQIRKIHEAAVLAA